MDDANKYYSVVTDVGNAMMVAALASGERLTISEIAAGDGGGAYYRPDPDMTALKNEVWRGKVNSCEQSLASENILVITGIIPAETGGFTIREIAVYADTGEMIAIANTPSTPKVNVVDGIINEMSLALEIALLNQDVVSLMIDPHIVTATKLDIQNVIKQLNELAENVNATLKSLQEQIGDLSLLKTESRCCLVDAVNEIAEIVRPLHEYGMATDQDIEDILAGIYVDDVDGVTMLDIASLQDIDDIIAGIYTENVEEEDPDAATDQDIDSIIDGSYVDEAEDGTGGAETDVDGEIQKIVDDAFGEGE